MSYVVLIIVGYFISLLSIDLLGSLNSAQLDTSATFYKGWAEITLQRLLFPEPCPSHILPSKESHLTHNSLPMNTA